MRIIDSRCCQVACLAYCDILQCGLRTSGFSMIINKDNSKFTMKTGEYRDEFVKVLEKETVHDALGFAAIWLLLDGWRLVASALVICKSSLNAEVTDKKTIGLWLDTNYVRHHTSRGWIGFKINNTVIENLKIWNERNSEASSWKFQNPQILNVKQ